MLVMRAYELMVIFDADVADATIQGHLKTLIAETVEADGGSIAKVDNWGKRRFAYRINHKWEGTYVVLEINVSDSLTKGSRVVVHGRLDQRSWETQDGDRRSKVEVIADDVAPSLKWATVELTRNEYKGDGGGGGFGGGGGGAPRAVSNEPAPAPQYDMNEEPF